MSGTYLSASEVVNVLPAAATIGASTIPINLGEVASWIQNIGARVNAAAAAAGYAVPIPPSAGDAYAVVQEIVRDGVTCRILRRLMPNAPDSRSKPSVSETYCKAFDDAMKDLREGKLPLVGVGQDAGTEGRELPRSFETSNVGATIGGASPLLSTRMVF